VLDARFSGRVLGTTAPGRARPDRRPFSIARVAANKEYRAVAGLALAMVLLWVRMRFG
jgi:hypothetical protein